MPWHIVWGTRKKNEAINQPKVKKTQVRGTLTNEVKREGIKARISKLSSEDHIKTVIFCRGKSSLP